MNLDALRRKRVKRLGVKVTAHTGQRRIYFILDRATRKFHGDVGLWMQYIEYARKQKAYKKLSQVLTNVLRLHPTKPELWIYAAKYVLEEQADMTEARSYMQRGLRFCKSSKKLWLEYGKLEMIYIAKIAARRKILGLIEIKEKTDDATLDDPDADVIPVPALTGEDINPNLAKDDDVDQVALQNLDSTPALSGAIPIVIFDTGMKQFQNEESFGKDFYGMAAEFESVPCLPKILNHIVDALLQNSSSSYLSHMCHVQLAVVGIPILSADFPSAFSTALNRLKTHLSDPRSDAMLSRGAITWLLPIFKEENLDPGLKTVCSATIRKLVRNIAASPGIAGLEKLDISQLATLLQEAGLAKDANILSAAFGSPN
jgi:U3 small nucleolar RNA-associated protein 6